MHHYYNAPSLFAALRAREMGIHQPTFDSHLLGALRTTVDDEYSFWNVEGLSTPVAIPPFAIQFSNTALHGHALLAADEDGIITILDTRRSLRTQLHAFPLSADAPPTRFRAHTNAIFDAVWMNGDRDIATASGDTTARVFDIERHMRKATCRGASGSVKAVRNLADSAYVLATAARDGTIRIYDIRCPTHSDPSFGYESYNSPLLRIEKAHARPAHQNIAVTANGRKRRRTVQDSAVNGSVTALVTVPTRSNYFLTAGAADGTIKLWDLRKISSPDDDHLINFADPGEQRQWEHGQRRRQYGIASLDVDRSGSRLIASATDSCIYMYDVRDLNLGYSCMLAGHKQTSFYIRAKFSPCGRFVGSGSADSKVYLWDTLGRSEHARMEPVLMLDGHRGGDAAGVDWCKTEPHKLVSYSDDSTVKLWTKETGCTAGPVKSVSDCAIFMGARKVEVTRKAEPVKGRALGTRRLRDSDIRSYFKGVVSRPERTSSSEETDGGSGGGSGGAGGGSLPGSPIDSTEPNSPLPQTPPVPPPASRLRPTMRVRATRSTRGHST